MKRNRLFIAILCLALAAVLVSCAEEKTETTKTENTKTETAATTSTAAPAEAPAAKPAKVLSFDSETIEGEKIADDYYKGYDVILVNFMSTTCPPCVKEIPELQEIHEENNGFGVIGFVADTVDRKTGEKKSTLIDDARNIKEKTGALYPFVLPTLDIFNVAMGKLVPVFPMSYIVDNTGKVIKGPIAGAHSKAEWLDLLEEARNSISL